MRVHRFLTIVAAAALITSFSLAAGPAETASAASVPYVGYTYDGWGDRVPAPVAYAPDRVVTGEELGIGAFASPEDVYVTAGSRIYIADTGNSRIVELDASYKLVKVFDKFALDGKEEKFAKPQGVFVTETGEIYIADTGNHRVVKMNESGVAERVVASPKSDFLADGFVFDPKKVAVDSADRLYVIADRVFDGIMEFDASGAFVNFYGAERVQYDAVDYFWKKYLSTKAQRERMELFVPTEYTNMDLDPAGFVFTSSADNSGAAPKPIKRHNPTGTDVLLRQGFANPSGDLRYDPIAGPSRLVDIDVGPDGVYSALDNKRGRIFTYSSEGKLMYIFGGFGDRVGNFQLPTSLDRVGDDMVVMDKNLQRMTVFRATPFGKVVNEAVHYHTVGDEKKAGELWREVLALDANFDIAYTGVSKSLVRAGDYGPAVKDAKLGMDRTAYSKAYHHYRKEVLKGHFNAILTVALALGLLWALRKPIRRLIAAIRKRGGNDGVKPAA